jgi:hypothetical protein
MTGWPRIIKNQECRKNRSQIQFRQCPSIYLEELGNITYNLCYNTRIAEGGTLVRSHAWANLMTNGIVCM